MVEEADETIYWLELISAAKVASGSDLQWLIGESNELSRIFNQSQLTARANAAVRRNR